LGVNVVTQFDVKPLILPESLLKITVTDSIDICIRLY
jgi:hypothetical protein